MKVKTLKLKLRDLRRSTFPKPLRAAPPLLKSGHKYNELSLKITNNVRERNHCEAGKQKLTFKKISLRLSDGFYR